MTTARGSPVTLRLTPKAWDARADAKIARCVGGTVSTNSSAGTRALGDAKAEAGVTRRGPLLDQQSIATAVNESLRTAEDLAPVVDVTEEMPVFVPTRSAERLGARPEEPTSTIIAAEPDAHEPLSRHARAGDAGSSGRDPRATRPPIKRRPRDDGGPGVVIRITKMRVAVALALLGLLALAVMLQARGGQRSGGQRAREGTVGRPGW